MSHPNGKFTVSNPRVAKALCGLRKTTRCPEPPIISNPIKTSQSLLIPFDPSVGVQEAYKIEVPPLAKECYLGHAAQVIDSQESHGGYASPSLTDHSF